MKKLTLFPGRSGYCAGALPVLCAAALTACGGGGGGSTTPPPPPPTPPPVVVPPPVSLPAMPGDFGGKRLSTVARTGVAGGWGYTAPDGSRYALMGTAKGILVLDLRDSANPRVVDEIDGPTNTPSPGVYWREMRTYGTHAYIVSEQDNVRGGVMILDLSALPASVSYVKSFTPRDGTLRSHTIDIDTVRGLAYLPPRRQSPHRCLTRRALHCLAPAWRRPRMTRAASTNMAARPTARSKCGTSKPIRSIPATSRPLT
ncbi:MAG: hypothetical protein WKG03_16920 [Telluria sp.]